VATLLADPTVDRLKERFVDVVMEYVHHTMELRALSAAMPEAGRRLPRRREGEATRNGVQLKSHPNVAQFNATFSRWLQLVTRLGLFSQDERNMLPGQGDLFDEADRYFSKAQGSRAARGAIISRCSIPTSPRCRRKLDDRRNRASVAASTALCRARRSTTSEQLGLSPILMGAANSSGGVMGKMIDAQSIVVASTATNWFGHEGTILRFVFWHSIALACLVGVLVMLQSVICVSRMRDRGANQGLAFGVHGIPDVQPSAVETPL
jgi:L-lactate permease